MITISEEELESLRQDKELLDWCERELISLVDGGGSYIIEFGSVANPRKLGDNEILWSVRRTINAARQSQK